MGLGDVYKRQALVEEVRETAVAVWEQWFALDLIVDDGRCRGVRALDPNGEVHEITARHVLLATGGCGQIYAATTNPVQSTGDGLAMALRAGVACADVEFMQFHPTALLSPRVPRPLLSEALRGHGALIRDLHGERFVDELQPRDVVARAITAKLLEQDTDHLWLDATGLESFDERFPTITADLRAAGLDPAMDWLPIAPAAHYHCGGVVTDLEGATSLPGLWAAGEVACTGVHGANRLASNSLLEGMVFGPRVIESIGRGVEGPARSGAMRAVLPGDYPAGTISGKVVEPVAAASPAAPGPLTRDRLQREMQRGAGVLRTASSLQTVRAVAQAMLADIGDDPRSFERAELRNLATVADALLVTALEREESRGCHTRTDHPNRRDDLRLRLVLGPEKS